MPETLVGVRYLVNMYRGTDSSWKYGDVPVYRAYNPNGFHLFTTSWDEYQSVARAGWRKEGVAFRLTGKGTVAVYRLYNPNNGDHVFTTSKDEYDRVAKAGWRGEGTAFVADESGNFPVYRNYNPNSGEHFYTASKAEYDHLVKAGWKGEGVCFYGYSLPCMDTQSDSQADGVNVQVGRMEFERSQAWNVFQRPDGSYRLVNRATGKCLDANGIAAGANVRQMQAEPGDGQRWAYEKVATATLFGATVDVVRVTPASDTSLALDTASDAMGANVQLKAVSPTDLSQRWAWVDGSEVEHLEGLFELRLLSRTSLCMDVVSEGAANGTRVQVYDHDGGDAQKWRLHDTGSGCTLMSEAAGRLLCLDTDANALREGMGVDVWSKMADGSDDFGFRQCFKVERHGTTTVDGRKCAVVSLGAANGSDYRVAAQGAGRSASVCVTTEDLDDDQLWALYPCDGSDATLPVPAGLSMADAVGEAAHGPQPYGETKYPTWYCEDAWLAGDNHYQIRWRTRYYTGTTWGAWGAWTDWAERPTETAGAWAWMSSGVDTSFGLPTQAVQVHMQVRVVGQADWGQVHGGTCDEVATVGYEPEVTLSSAGWGPDGLTIQYASSLPRGTNVRITSLEADGAEVLRHEQRFSALDDSTSLVVPASELVRTMADGATAVVTYQVGTPVVPLFGDERTATVEVAWSAGSVDVTPTVTANQDRTLTVSMPHLGTERAWVSYEGGTQVDFGSPTLSGSTATWQGAIDYPFAGKFRLFVSARSADGDSWGVSSRELEASSLVYGPCHKLVWGTGDERRAFLVELDESPLAASNEWAPDYSDVTLSGRGNHAVTYPGPAASDWKVSGWLVGGFSYSLREDFDALKAQRYLTYYAPNGAVAKVAVTSASYAESHGGAHVEMTLREVG